MQIYISLFLLTFLSIESYGHIVPSQTYKLPSSPDCGTVSADRNHETGWPWIVLLGYTKLKDGPISWLCTGTLITPRHVLTAAHCQNPVYTLVKIRWGQLNLGSDVTEADEIIDVNVENRIDHASFGKLFNDVAILRLQNDIPISKKVRPICLPKSPELMKMTFTNDNVKAAGWGVNLVSSDVNKRILRTVQLTVIDNDECQKIYRNKTEIQPTHLCARAVQEGKGTCSGDGGGPLMWKNGDIYYQIGIVSFGSICGKPQTPDVFTRITSFIDWIEENIK